MVLMGPSLHRVCEIVTLRRSTKAQGAPWPPYQQKRCTEPIALSLLMRAQLSRPYDLQSFARQLAVDVPYGA